MGRYKDILVIDLEATCWRGRPPEGMRSEIIEIGVTKLDYRTKKIIGSEGIIVKNEQSNISEFCTKLTTIDQDLIDKEGISFKDACEKLRKNYKSEKSVYISWGDYDRDQVKRCCKAKNVKNPFGRTHFNLKSMLAMLTGEHELGVSSALAYFDLEFEGQSHRGVDDARNTSRIFQKMVKRFNLKIS